MHSSLPAIKRLTLEHLRAVSTLESRCFCPPWSEVAIEAQLSLPLAYNIGIASPQNPHALCASLLGLDCGAREMEILRIATDPQMRRQGLGISLLHCLRQECQHRQIERILLEVSVDNPAAIGLYLREGFTQKGRRPRYYSDGSDALILVQEL